MMRYLPLILLLFAAPALAEPAEYTVTLTPAQLQVLDGVFKTSHWEFQQTQALIAAINQQLTKQNQPVVPPQEPKP